MPRVRKVFYHLPRVAKGNTTLDAWGPGDTWTTNDGDAPDRDDVRNRITDCIGDILHAAAAQGFAWRDLVRTVRINAVGELDVPCECCGGNDPACVECGGFTS